MKSNVTYLQVPYKEKEIAKDLGAKWDPQERLWFIPNGIELKDFSRWLPQKVDGEQKQVGA